MKVDAISPQPSDDEAAAITAALARLYAERGHESVLTRSRWGRELKLAATPELKLGYYNSELGYYNSELGYYGSRSSWTEISRREAIDAGV